MNVIYVIGVFDLFHRGHLELLKRAKDLGDRLIVAVNGDDMVSSYKRTPYLSENDRMEIVKGCRYVDEAFIIRKYDNKEFIEKYSVTKIVHGDDWEESSYMEQIRVSPEYLKEQNCELILLPYTRGISTSELIKIIKES
ncbi:adenylyltransferase/cytidyltransferase family protein [Sphingobacterium yanglingense]|uniref:Glycerol-3-phosphate cytidylyltransferase n=1 Tax=Sphingobacterium yanglingense TaxID=1437280 RepID=A0A4R6WHV6_9SPHI|nr:adenylyltransferase/cytidyltransferase family protein [Sphingobacterium yanglingense]TDQ77987.1 glycerol-3-phosphate cytidylyltransferase [Sphingobacterium yanglingense]